MARADLQPLETSLKEAIRSTNPSYVPSLQPQLETQLNRDHRGTARLKSKHELKRNPVGTQRANHS